MTRAIGRQHGTRDPPVFADLNLDRVFAAVMGRAGRIRPGTFFSAPLHDVQAVEYRHQILRDMHDGALSRALAEFADRTRDMRKHLGQARKLRNRYQKESWFLDAARICCQAVSALAGALTTASPGSCGFTAFREYLADYTTSQAFTGLTADIGRVTDALAPVRYCVTIRGIRVKVTRYEGEEAEAGPFGELGEHYLGADAEPVGEFASIAQAVTSAAGCRRARPGRSIRPSTA